MADSIEQDSADKDTPLRYDIRLLGRILGETIRAQDGGQTSTGGADPPDGAAVPPQRRRCGATGAAGDHRGLPIAQAIRIIRAFGHFSHLANIAEDQHHIRRIARAHMARRRHSPARSHTPWRG